MEFRERAGIGERVQSGDELEVGNEIAEMRIPERVATRVAGRLPGN